MCQSLPGLIPFIRKFVAEYLWRFDAYPLAGPMRPGWGIAARLLQGGLIHVSGTVARADETGQVPEGVVAQCQSALSIIEDALAAAGASFADVVRVTYYLPKAADFEACWPLLAQTFGDNPPAATMIECNLIDPKYKIEIEITAQAASYMRAQRNLLY